MRSVIIYIFISSFCFISNIIAQTTVSGKVIDIATNEPIGFITVYSKKANHTAITQLNGTFSVKVAAEDSIFVSGIGYKEVAIPYNKNTKQPITISIKQISYDIDLIVVRPGINPAHKFVKLAIENRKNNKPDNISDIDFLEYNKLNINISKVDSSVVNNKIVKDKSEIFVKINDYDDSWCIPLYFSEQLQYTKKTKNLPPETQEIVSNKHGTGFIKSEIVNEYIASLNPDISFYGNLRFLTKDFISPISPQAFLFYKYILKDSIMNGNNMYYKINFRPKNKRDLAFYGYMILEKETGALVEIDATLQKTANVNYVNSIHLQEKYQQTAEGKWFHKQNSLNIEFYPKLSKDTSSTFLNTPMYAVKNTMYIIDSAQIADAITNKVAPSKFGLKTKKLIEDSVVLQKFRPENLTSLDVNTQKAIEAANDIPAIKITNKVLDMLLYGYYKTKYLDFGPYTFFMQANEIEKFRCNLSFKTSEQLFKKMLLGGYIGYGVRDKKFKFGVRTSLELPLYKKPIFHVKYDQNIYRIGDYKQSLDYIRENAMNQSDDNLIGSFLSRAPNKAVYFVKKLNLQFEQPFTKNFVITPSFSSSIHFSPEFFPFDTTSTITNFSLQEYGCNVRISFDEQIAVSHFKKTYIDTRYPVFHINGVYGSYHINKQTNSFLQFRFVTKQKILLGIGRLSYVVEAGLITKPVPFTLLEYQRGNQTMGGGEFYFNAMNYMEFVSDRFINVFTEYNTSGYFLNKIPGVNRFNLREVFSLKGCWGQLQNQTAHNAILAIPSTSNAFTKPYFEAGVGITNIFKIFRVDYIWRLSYLNNPDIVKRGLFFKFTFSF